MSNQSFQEIVDEIVITHHSFLRRELPRVTEALSALVAECSDYEPLQEAQQIFAKVRNKIETHLRDEESFLFPTGIALESGAPLPQCELNLVERLAEMEKEHDGCGSALSTIAQMVATCPESDLRSQVIGRLEAVLNDLDVHVEKENTRVHPRFLELYGAE